MARKTEQIVVQLRDGELARRVDGKILVRVGAVRVRFEIADVGTADEHQLRVVFGCAVVARVERAERQMLDEAFFAGGKESCNAGDVVKLLGERVNAAAGKLAATKGAEEWLEDGSHPILVEAMRKAVDAAGFGCGLEAVGPYEIYLESPSLEQARRMRRAAERIKEFEAIRAESPWVSVSGVIAQIAEEDQASVVRGLIEARQSAATDLYVVAGPCLMRVSGEEMEHVRVSEEIGPFRSLRWVQVGEMKKLAIGGRAGIVLFEPSANDAQVYAAGEMTSAMGFNSVVVFGGRIWGSHSEMGLVGWDLRETGKPAMRIGEMGGTRELCVVGERMVFCAGAGIYSVDEKMKVSRVAEGAGEGYVALLDLQRNWIGVRPSGEVEMFDRETMELVRRDRRSGRVSAAGLMPFYDSPRVLLAGEDGPILCVSMEDGVVTQYVSGHRGLKAVVGSMGGQVAGVSGDRQRVVLFDGKEEKPREVYVGGRVKHRVGDIVFDQ